MEGAGPTTGGAGQGRSVAQKLGLRPGSSLTLLGAPEGWEPEGMPAGVLVEYSPFPGPKQPLGRGHIQVLVAFCFEMGTVIEAAPALAGAVRPDGALWVAWPRRAGGHRSDITDNSLRAGLLPLGLVDVKVAALGQDWSGLKFVWRKELRSLVP